MKVRLLQRWNGIVDGPHEVGAVVDMPDEVVAYMVPAGVCEHTDGRAPAPVTAELAADVADVAGSEEGEPVENIDEPALDAPVELAADDAPKRRGKQR